MDVLGVIALILGVLTIAFLILCEMYERQLDAELKRRHRRELIKARYEGYRKATDLWLR